MVTLVTRRDLLWGYMAQALNIGAGLILLPVILHYLPAEDVGLWFVFITLASLAQLLEFGFQPTLARNTAYVYAGAQALNKKGLPSGVNVDSVINGHLLAELVVASRFIYRVVASLAALILLGGGTLYISTVITPQQDATQSYLAWVAFALGYIITFYYGYFNGLLQGRGDITAANKVIIVTRGSLVVLGAVAVGSGFGMLGLGIASFISSIVGRCVAKKFYFSPKRPELRENAGENTHSQALLKTLWHNAWRLGAVQLGAFLILRANILIASSFLGLSVAASYGMTITVLMALGGVSGVISQVYLPNMNMLQSVGDKTTLRSLYGEIAIISWVVYLSGLTVLLLGGNIILKMISSTTPLLEVHQLFILGVITLLEVNHTIAATYLTTKNKVPFLGAAIISGISIVILSLGLIGSYGTWGLIISQGVIQLMYNNWRWPKDAVNDLGGNLYGLLAGGIHRVKGHFAI